MSLGSFHLLLSLITHGIGNDLNKDSQARRAGNGIFARFQCDVIVGKRLFAVRTTILEFLNDNLFSAFFHTPPLLMSLSEPQGQGLSPPAGGMKFLGSLREGASQHSGDRKERQGS